VDRVRKNSSKIKASNDALA